MEELQDIEIKKLGEHEVIKRNYPYLLLAQQKGFFQDGFDSQDIASCSDWIVAWWIDELDDKNKEKKRFVDEILLSFKRWFSNGLKSTGVGKCYDVLKSAEIEGLKVDNELFNCMISLMYSKRISSKMEISNYKSTLDHFTIKDIITNLVAFTKRGIPLGYSLAVNYDCLLKLVNGGIKIDFDTFMLLYTAGMLPDHRKIQLYEEAKAIKEEYGYSTCNADEVSRLGNYLVSGGYNIAYVMELQDKIKRCEQVISRYENYRIPREKMLNKKVLVTFFVLDQYGNRTPHKISGDLISYDGNVITLRKQDKENDAYKDIVIRDDDRSIVSKITSEGITLYECRVVNEKIQRNRAKLKIQEIQNDDVLSRYVTKYGSIEGLAYLKRSADLFISTVEPGQVPIDNLFTCCFETISEFKMKSPQEFLQYAMSAYNYIMSGKVESLDKINYGYPVNKFLSKDMLSLVRQVCYYVVTARIKADVPGYSADTDSIVVEEGTMEHAISNDDVSEPGVNSYLHGRRGN